MDSATKTKIILFSVLGILGLGFVLVLLNSGSSGAEQKEDVALRAIDTAEVSVQDIMAQRGDNHNYQTDASAFIDSEPYPQGYGANLESTEDQEKEIALIQEQLRQNIANQVVTPSPRQTTEHIRLEEPQPTPISSASPSVSAERTNPQPTTTQKALEEPDPAQEPKKQNRFYSGKRSASSVVNVAVLGDQEIQQGSSLKMALQQPLRLENITVPKGTAIYGVVRTTPNRLYVTIQSVRYGDRIMPYTAQVYDRDGLEGINIIEAPSENLAQDVGESVAQDVAASAGILSGTIGRAVSTVSNIFRRRSNGAIMIKSNYQLSIK